MGSIDIRTCHAAHLLLSVRVPLQTLQSSAWAYLYIHEHTFHHCFKDDWCGMNEANPLFAIYAEVNVQA